MEMQQVRYFVALAGTLNFTRAAEKCNVSLLGPRPDKSPFSNDDLDALAAILPALKRALFATRERELEREQDLVEQQSLLEAVQNLQVRLAALEGAQARN